MRYILSIPHFREGVLVAGGVVAAIVVIWLVTRLMRPRNVVLSSETADMIAYQLGRIADAMEGSKGRQEARPAAPLPAETAPTRHVSMSMLGR